jgi:hypothetical protein
MPDELHRLQETVLYVQIDGVPEAVQPFLDRQFPEWRAVGASLSNQQGTEWVVLQLRRK